MREYEFLNGTKITGAPVMSANMDTTGTFEIALILAKHKCFTAVMKQYTFEHWEKFGRTNPDALPFVAVSAGISDNDFTLASKVLETF